MKANTRSKLFFHLNIFILLAFLFIGCVNKSEYTYNKKLSGTYKMKNDVEIKLIDMKNIKLHRMAEINYEIINNSNTTIGIGNVILCIPLSNRPTGNQWNVLYKEKFYTEYKAYYNGINVYIENYDARNRRFCAGDVTERIASLEVNPKEKIRDTVLIPLDFPYKKDKNYKSDVDYPYTGDFINP